MKKLSNYKMHMRFNYKIKKNNIKKNKKIKINNIKQKKIYFKKK